MVGVVLLKAGGALSSSRFVILSFEKVACGEDCTGGQSDWKFKMSNCHLTCPVLSGGGGASTGSTHSVLTVSVVTWRSSATHRSRSRDTVPSV